MKGDLSFTATDSSFTTYLDKIAGTNVQDIRGGNVGIEIRMGVNYTEAVVKRGMSLERYVDVTSANGRQTPGPLSPQGGNRHRERRRHRNHRSIGEVSPCPWPTCTFATTAPWRAGMSRVGPPPWS